MGSTSATGAVTNLSVAACQMVELLRASIEETAATGAVTTEGLSAHWYELPFDEFATGIVGCAKPPTHLPLKERKALPEPIAQAMQRAYTRLVTNPVIEDTQRVSEHVAADLVESFTSTATAIYTALISDLSTRHWHSRIDDDGRVTIGNTPSGRRKRATVDSLIQQDQWAAIDAGQKIRYPIITLAVTGGAHRRLARTTRLANGLSGPDVQTLMYRATQSRYPIAFNITGWEGNTTRGTNPDGSAIHPYDFPAAWPYLAHALNLPADLDDGPLVPVITIPPAEPGSRSLSLNDLRA